MKRLASGFWPLFAILFFGYLLIGLRVEAGGILDYFPGRVGSVFGYDNQLYSTVPSTVVWGRHPLASFFYSFPRELLQHFFAYRTVLILEIIIRSAFVAATVSLVYHYCGHFVGLPPFTAVLLSLLLGSCYSTFLLSFTPDLYTFSFFALALALLFQTKMLQGGAEMRSSCRNITFWSIVLGSITVTNLLKPLCLALVLPISFRQRLLVLVRSGLRIGMFFLLVFAPFYLMSKWYIHHEMEVGGGEKIEVRRLFEPVDIPPFVISDQPQRAGTFVGFVSQDPIPAQERFWAHPILWPTYDLVWAENPITEKLQPSTPGIEPLYKSPYKAIYGYGLWLLALLVILFVRHRRVLLLALYLVVDVGVHLVAGFGNEEAALYSGHWLFVLPMLLAWGIRAISEHLKINPAIRSRILFSINIFLLIAVSLQFVVNCPLIAKMFGGI